MKRTAKIKGLQEDFVCIYGNAVLPEQGILDRGYMMGHDYTILPYIDMGTRSTFAKAYEGGVVYIALYGPDTSRRVSVHGPSSAVDLALEELNLTIEDI